MEGTLDNGRNERYARIRARAGEIWQQEGCPANQHERHWLLAMREIDGEDAAALYRPSPSVPSPLIRTPGRARLAPAILQKSAYRLRSSRL